MLDKKSKINLWNEKLNQLIEQDLPIQSKNLIKKLILELNKEEVDSKIINSIAIDLATTIPEEDFYKMFTELNDYEYEGQFKGKTKVTKEIINSIYSMNYTYKTNTLDIQSTNKVGACNCNWTCNLYVGSSTANCKSTSSGCGFLWAFPCERRVSPN